MKRYLLIMLAMMAFFLLLFFAVESLGVPLLVDPTPWLRHGGVLAAALGVGLLIADVLLPVPSSLVMVAHGALFGVNWDIAFVARQYGCCAFRICARTAWRQTARATGVTGRTRAGQPDVGALGISRSGCHAACPIARRDSSNHDRRFTARLGPDGAREFRRVVTSGAVVCVDGRGLRKLSKCDAHVWRRSAGRRFILPGRAIAGFSG